MGGQSRQAKIRSDIDTEKTYGKRGGDLNKWHKQGPSVQTTQKTVTKVKIRQFV